MNACACSRSSRRGRCHDRAVWPRRGDGQPDRHVVSAVYNLLGAIKAAKHSGLGRRDAISTDGPDRYRSVMDELDAL